MTAGEWMASQGGRAGQGAWLERLAVAFARAGGLVISGVGLMSAASICGRALFRRPILGDFELVEMGTAIAGSLFLPYCQVARGHVIVDLFTLRLGAGPRRALDRFGALVMATMLLLVGWRTLVGCVDIARSGETTMLMGVPLWIGYAAMLPGVTAAALVALAEGLGVGPPEPPR